MFLTLAHSESTQHHKCLSPPPPTPLLLWSFSHKAALGVHLHILSPVRQNKASGKAPLTFLDGCPHPASGTLSDPNLCLCPQPQLGMQGPGRTSTLAQEGQGGRVSTQGPGTVSPHQLRFGTTRLGTSSEEQQRGCALLKGQAHGQEVVSVLHQKHSEPSLWPGLGQVPAFRGLRL